MSNGSASGIEYMPRASPSTVPSSTAASIVRRETRAFRRTPRPLLPPVAANASVTVRMTAYCLPQRSVTAVKIGYVENAVAH